MGLKSTIAQMVANSSYEVRPTAIYANPVLLDLIDREMKAEFNVVLSTAANHRRADGEDSQHASRRIAADSGMGARIHRDAGKRHGGAAGYIVSEDLIEYHWLTDPNPRVFQAGTAEIH